MKRFSTLFMMLLVLLAAHLQAQDVKDVKVNDLSNSQVKEAKQALDNSGLSRDAAIEMAKQKGASDQQIQEMLNRMDGLDNQSQSATKAQPKAEESAKQDQTQEETKNEKNKKAAVVKNKGRRFGNYLFSGSNITFEPNPNLPTPKNYRINIGDQILITIWGNSQASYQLEVNRNGQIMIPDIGPIHIAGMTFENAEDKLTQQLSTIYADMKGRKPKTFAQIDLGKMRSIKVNIIGEASAPGVYTLPATATAFNALYLSGGPDAIGSFRNIKIIRNNKPIKTIDTYKYLLDGDLSDNIILEDEDVIYIPTINKQVEVSGSFKRNALFELKANEKLPDLINFAAGYTDETYRHRMKLYRKTQIGMEIIDFTQNQIPGIGLKDGDRLVAEKILDTYNNRVTINGSVLRPGEYELTPGLTLSQLITKADSITPDAYEKSGHIIRYNEDLSTRLISFNLKDILKGKNDITLQPEDVIFIKSHFQMQQAETVSINGQVQQPNTFPYMEGMTLRDAIYLANGFKEDADSTNIEVSRRLGYAKEAELGDTLRYTFHFSLDRSLDMDDPSGKFLLQPYDQIAVRKAPGYRTPAEATVQGEVTLAGNYALNVKNLRISDLVEKAGGITPEAFAEGAQFQRKNATLGTENVAVNLNKILQNPSSPDNLLLMNGDVLTIPKRLQTVKVSGNVLNPMSQVYKPGHSVRYYVEKSGGFDERTRKSKVYVKYANGSTATTHTFLWHNYPSVEPGSQIIVPVKPEKQHGDNTAKYLAFTSAISTLAIALANLLK